MDSSVLAIWSYSSSVKIPIDHIFLPLQQFFLKANISKGIATDSKLTVRVLALCLVIPFLTLGTKQSETPLMPCSLLATVLAVLTSVSWFRCNPGNSIPPSLSPFAGPAIFIFYTSTALCSICYFVLGLFCSRTFCRNPWCWAAGLFANSCSAFLPHKLHRSEKRSSHFPEKRTWKTRLLLGQPLLAACSL